MRSMIARTHRPTPRRRPRRLDEPFEVLEDRTLLSIDLASAIALPGPSAQVSGMLAPGSPLLFRIDSGGDARLTARVDAAGTEARLSLLDAQGNVLVQSDGQPRGGADPLIDQHVTVGTFYLELESLRGTGDSSLRTTLVSASAPFAPIPAGPEVDFIPIAVGDFNHDGTPDYVTLDGVHLGTGDGTFEPALPGTSIAAVAADPADIKAGDFFNTGQTDLALADYQSGHVDILLGHGDGTFSAPACYPVGTNPDAIAVGNFLGDGRQSLAVADAGSNNVAILPNNGDGTFGGPTFLPVGRYPSSIVAGDFSGDGRTDLAVADYFSNDVNVLMNQGGGNFAKPVVYPVGTGSSWIVAADFRGNHRLDLAVTDTTSNDVSILMNRGDGTFAPPVAYTVGQGPASVVTGDFNGTGNIDLAIAEYDSSTVTILGGKGDGTFGGAATYASGLNPQVIVSGDFNGDGRPDLSVTNSTSDDITVLLADRGSVGSFRSAGMLPLGDVPDAIAPGDFNGDGHTDLAVADSGSNAVSILLGNGDGTFDPARSLPVGAYPFAIVAGDFNGDGHTDLATADLGSDEVSILLGEGDGTFLPAVSYRVGSAPRAIAMGDFDGDGHIDLAVADSVSNDVTILKGKGDGTFLNVGTVALDGSPRAIVAGHFTGDRHIDLAVTDLNSNDVTILTGMGDGTFEIGQVIPNVGSPAALTTGDFNGDGNADLAVADATGNVLVLNGNGDGTFGGPMTYPVGMEPSSITAGYFLGDGHLDLAVADYASNDVTILRGNGTGSFGPKIVVPVENGPLAIVSFGLSGDGSQDLRNLAIAQANQSGIQVYPGQGNGTFTEPVLRDSPLFANLSKNDVPDVAVVDAAGDVLFRRGLPGQPGVFDSPVTVNPSNPSVAIAAIFTGQGTLLASVDANDNALSLFVYRDGHFAQLWSLATGARPAQVVAGDLNGDGWDDLVVRDAGDGSLTLYLSDGKGWFLPRVDLPALPGDPDQTGLSDVSLADLDHDGRLDIIVTDKTSGDVRVLKNLGGGTFAPPEVFRAGVGLYGIGGLANVSGVSSLEGTSGVVAATSAPGSLPDLLTINTGSNTIGRLAALGDGRYANAEPIVTAAPVRVAVGADFFGNGLTDLAVLDASGVRIYGNDGQGGFTVSPFSLNAGASPTGLTVADVNGDGRPDLLVGNGFGDVLVLMNDGEGRFSSPEPVDKIVTLAVETSAAGPPSFVLADQGRDQVVARVGGTSDFVLVANQASGLIAPGAVVLADLNGDGIPDLIVANSGSNNVLVYPGLGSGRFGPPLNDGRGFFTGTNPTGITVADLNGDGRRDLVIANKGSNDVSVLINTQLPDGSYTFVPRPRLKVGAGPTATAVGDVNGDGVPDLFVSEGGSNDVRLLPGLGNGFFDDSATTVYATGVDPGALFVAHLTGPAGQLDLLTLNAGSNDLTLIRDVNGGNLVAQTLSSGGQFPIAAVLGDFGNGTTGLLVANNADGRLALFMAGADGLELLKTFEDPLLPHPTTLAMDGLGQVFGGTEGIEAAFQVILGLGAGGAAGGGAVFVAPPVGPGEQQVARLEPSGESPLALVVTLLSVSGEVGSLVPYEDLAQVPTTSETLAALPNQGLSPGGLKAGSSGLDEDANARETDASSPVATGQEAGAPFLQFVAGVEETFARAKAEVRPVAIGGGSTPARRGQRALIALDALLAKWRPVLSAVAGPAPKLAVDFLRTGLDAARLFDAAIQAIETEPGKPRTDSADVKAESGPEPATRSAVLASIALTALALPIGQNWIVRREGTRSGSWRRKKV